MEPFKNIFNKDSITKISKQISKFDKKFRPQSFVKDCLVSLEDQELKQRVSNIAHRLNEHLSADFKNNVKTLIHTLVDENHCLESEWESSEVDEICGFLVWPYTEYVSLFGQEDFDESMRALFEFTKRFTAEFAIRSFINSNPKKAFKYLGKWKKDPNKHVRRLVSEGTRPRLPWGVRCLYLDENLESTLNLIIDLGDDQDEYVRRSVANHLNDVFKLNESLCFKYVSKVKHSWVKRHALRGALKKGHPKALDIFGYSKRISFEKSQLVLKNKRVKEGQSLDVDYSFSLGGKGEKKILVEYIVHYKKKNGYSEKAFRLRDCVVKAKDDISISKRISFKKVTTRKHYSGEHFIEIQVNGKRLNKEKFILSV